MPSSQAISRGLLILGLLGALWISPADASLMVFEVDAASQPSAQLTFDLQATGTTYLTYTLTMPVAQAALTHHWRTEVWQMSHGGATLSVPLDLTVKGGVIEGTFMVKRDHLDDIFVVVRTGEHAPLAETHIRIDVASFAPAP